MTEDTVAVVPEQAAPTPGAGRLLSAAREGQGLSLEEVARSLKLAVRQVEAMERGEYDKLPGITFVRGFIRNYARLLQIDPEPLLGTLRQAEDEPVQSISMSSERIELSVGKGRPWLWVALLVLAALVAIPLLIYEALRGNHTQAVPIAESGAAAHKPKPQPPRAAPVPEAAAPAVSPAPAIAAAPAQPPVAPRTAPTLEFAFAKEAWTEVRDKNGKQLLAQLNPAGSRQTVTGEPPFSLVIGNAPDVTVTYHGKPVALAPYTKGDVARLTLE